MNKMAAPSFSNPAGNSNLSSSKTAQLVKPLSSGPHRRRKPSKQVINESVSVGAAPKTHGAHASINDTTDTVESRLTGLLSRNSEYMKQAAFKGRAAANARGLMNTSMGVGAVEDARIKAALPIAQQDASLYGQATLQDAGHGQSIERTNQQGLITRLNATHQGGVDRANATHSADLSLDNSTALASQSFQHQSQLQSQSHEQVMSANNASSANAAAINSQNQINTVLANPDLTPGQKQKMIENIKTYNTYVRDVVNGVRNATFRFRPLDAPAQPARPTTASAPGSQPASPVYRPMPPSSDDR